MFEPLLGVPCPLFGKFVDDPRGVRERGREESEIDTIAAELRRERGGSSLPTARGEDEKYRGDPSGPAEGKTWLGKVCSIGVDNCGERWASL